MAKQDFALLLNGLHDEFQPIGFYEEWLVVRIAECMWRLRRATRCESGSVREKAIWEDHRDNDQFLTALANKLYVLKDAERQLRESGNLSQKTYAEIAPLVEEQNRIQSERGNEPATAEIDRQMFLTCITSRRKALDSMYEGLSFLQGKRSDSLLDYNAIPPEEDMDKILRYEERMHRQLDWALQRLLERQEGRLVSPHPGPLP